MRFNSFEEQASNDAQRVTNLIQEIYIKNFAIIKRFSVIFEMGNGRWEIDHYWCGGPIMNVSLEMILLVVKQNFLIQGGIPNWGSAAVVEKLQEFGVEVAEDELMIQRELLQTENQTAVRTS